MPYVPLNEEMWVDPTLFGEPRGRKIICMNCFNVELERPSEEEPEAGRDETDLD